MESLQKEKNITYGLMVFLVTAWGLDYVVAKQALAVLEPLCLLFLKYSVGFLVILAIKLKKDRKSLLRKKDIPLLAACSISGEILYFNCEYTAMDYIPVSLITIILSFVPALSLIVEKIVFKKNPTKKMVIALFFCIMGVVLIIGVDFKILMEGRIFGYLLAFGAVISWNFYNFITAYLHDKYSSITLTFNQLLCTIILVSPYAIHNMSDISVFTPDVIGGIIYLGIFSAGLGFLIQVRSLHVLGPTTTAMFSNFLPITATFFGLVFLKETISLLQVIGGIIVISAGYLVIKEKGKMEEQSNGQES